MIPYGCQWVSTEDAAAVDDVLRSDYLTQGPAIPAFEGALARYCGVDHAVVVNSGSSALHLACIAAGLGPDDVLWTSPNTFVATASCALHCGARVDFVDIDAETMNLCPQRLAEKLETAARKNNLPKILIPVHFGGMPCDMAAIGELASRYGFGVIEDGAHALGAEMAGARVGSCGHASMTIFSFHPVKIIATGEGGALTTADEALAARLRRLRSNGITREPGEMEGASEGDWFYEQLEPGYNYRMTDMQAALGCSQMNRIDEFLARRRALAARYDELLADMPVGRPSLRRLAGSAWHLYVIHVPPERRSEIYGELRTAGIGVNVHYIPVHLHPYFRQLGFRPGDFPEAERHYASAVTLPLHPRLTEDQQDYVADTLRRALVGR